jgi:FMN phosphatase YigB (HAD superfamily)
MTTFTGREALFIDIDDTITRARDNGDGLPPKFCDVPMLYTMRQAAIEQKGMDPTEAERVIMNVLESVQWWHWADFIIALGLDSYKFWEFAYQWDLQYLEPTSPELPVIFDKMHRRGYRMFVTSNNPSTGILHKLRVAGLAEIWGSPYFLQYFGPPTLRHMKWDTDFWNETIAQSGLDPHEVVVIGDNWHDDIITPTACGIKRRIHLDHNRTEAPEHVDGVWKVSSWADISELLLSDVEAFQHCR